jgi:hypothetical protein
MRNRNKNSQNKHPRYFKMIGNMIRKQKIKKYIKKNEKIIFISQISIVKK